MPPINCLLNSTFALGSPKKQKPRLTLLSIAGSSSWLKSVMASKQTNQEILFPICSTRGTNVDLKGIPKLSGYWRMKTPAMFVEEALVIHNKDGCGVLVITIEMECFPRIRWEDVELPEFA